MKLRVLFFAALREQMKQSQGDYEFDEGATPSSVAMQLLGFNTTLIFAVNDDVVPADHRLKDGDQLAFIPPMAGG
jgi:molybdopterin converting factor small subunit